MAFGGSVARRYAKALFEIGVSEGAFARFETHPLMTAQEAQRAMQMVKDCTTAYRAPNA